MIKINISVECTGRSWDLRQSGCNLPTGYQAIFIEKGKKYTRKIYMTNSTNSLWFYIKDKGKNVPLQTDDIIYNLHTGDLTRKLWHIYK